MFKILELKEQRSEIIAQAEAIHRSAKGGSLSSKESASFDKLMAKADKLKGEIAHIEAGESVGQLRAELDRPDVRLTTAGQPGGSFGAVAMPSSKPRLNGFKDAEQANRAGQWLAAQFCDNEAATRFCNANGLPLNAATTGIGTKGGFLVPDELSNAIIALREEYGVFRQQARVVGMSSDVIHIPRRTGGLTASFTGENDEASASDVSWDNVTLTAKKLTALTRISSEIQEDAIIDIATMLAEEIGLAFAEKEDDAGFNGDGGSGHGGIVGVRPKIIDGTHTAGAVDVATATHDTFAEIDAIDLSILKAALPQFALRNAKWFCSQTAFSLVFERLVSAAGGNTMLILGGSASLTYLGYPVVISQKLPTSTGSLDAQVMLLFGDLQQASTLGSRRDIRLLASQHRYMEYDQVGILGTARFDIINHDLGDNTTAGPIVGLVGSSA